MFISLFFKGIRTFVTQLLHKQELSKIIKI